MSPPGQDPRVAEVAAAVAAHRPADDREAWSRARTLALLRWLPRPLDETADATHVTGSAIVTDGTDRVVLHRHKRLGVWLQPGGHVDPGESPATAAVRETREETGLAAVHPDGPRLLHVDVHPGPRGHLHLDLRYLLHADAGDSLAPASGESPHVRWFTLDEALEVADRSLAAAVRAVGVAGA